MCDAQGGEAAAWALAASPKTLNFPDSHYNQGGTEKQAQWQMRLLSAGAGARGGCLCFPKDYCLIFIGSCAPCSSYPQNLELFTPGMLGGQGGGFWSLSAVVLAFHRARRGEWAVSGSESGSEVRQCGRRSVRLQRRLGTDSGPRELPFIEQLLCASPDTSTFTPCLHSNALK